MRQKGQDFATGKIVELGKPEESVRQEFEKYLHQDYGYDRAQMDIEVPVYRGSKRGEKMDLVIYKNPLEAARDQSRHILGIIECKAPNTPKKESSGIGQLKSYMTATSSLWGIWTNGSDIAYFHKNPNTGAISDDILFDIPVAGMKIEDIGKLSKQNLRKAENLKLIFRRILRTLYSNTNISRRERLGVEMIRLIFSKIMDERFYPDQLPEFRAGTGESPLEVKKRIDSLFEKVKGELEGDEIFDKHEKINLDPKAVAWVVGQLQTFSLMKTDKDVVGDAFEVFTESKFVGEKGEFFTPRPIVRLAVSLASPKIKDRILDPACGSGGFLIYALASVWEKMGQSRKYSRATLEDEKRNIAQRNFFGIEKESDLVKIAKAYMAITGDGRSGIVQENSLHSPGDFGNRAQSLFVENGNLRQFDVILTNPPFGSKIKVLEEDSARFKLGHKWSKLGEKWSQTSKVQATDPYILFIEKCLDFLKDGGRIAIVLPETVFHAPSRQYVRNFITQSNNITAIIDLSHNAFRPHCNAKTCLLVLQKNRPQQEWITMGVVEQIGHDHQGKPLYRIGSDGRPSEEIWNDAERLESEILNPQSEANQYAFTKSSAEVIESDILVPRYYSQSLIRDTRQRCQSIEASPVSMEELIGLGIISARDGHGSPRSQFKGLGDIPYIRVDDVVDLTLYHNPVSRIPEHEYNRIRGSKTAEILPGDVVFVRRGSYRNGTVAMVSPRDTMALYTRELLLLRVENEDNEYGITPYYLLYLLNHEIVQRQIPRITFMDTTLPNIGDRWKQLLLPIHKDHAKRSNVAEKVKTHIQTIWKANSALHKLLD